MCSVAVQLGVAIKAGTGRIFSPTQAVKVPVDLMKKTLMAVVMAAGLAPAATASAASVINRDDVEHTLIVTEGGNQVELSIGPGETIEICPEGCFVTMPNGDREVLTGSETLSIEASRGSIF